MVTKNDLKSKDKIFQSLDNQGKIIHVSDGWLEKLGYDRKEVIGKFFGTFLDDKSLPQVQKNFPHLKDYGFVNNVPLLVKMKNGTLTEAVLNGISEYDEEGKFQNTVCEIRTVHDILHSELEVKKMLENERFLRNTLNLKANILQLMHHEDDLKLFLNHIIHTLSEPLDIKAVYIVDGESIYGHPNAIENETIDSLYPLLKDDVLFFETKEESSSQELLQLMQKTDVFGFSGKAISVKDHNIYILFFLNKIELKDEWKNALKEVVSLFDYAVRSIINKEEKEALTKQLKELSVTDALTGAYNRHKLISVLEDEEKRVQRYGGYFTLIMFDIDHFKVLNDTYGHSFGDHVLVHIARIVKQTIRSSDMLFRYGGEEFIVFLPNTNLEAAVITAEKIRQVITEYEFGHEHNVSASFGVTQYDRQSTIKDVLKKVDQLLYSAKDSGRNCVKSV